MKFRNLSLIIVFVFCASLMVFCLCREAEEMRPEYTFEWNIPASIQARYTSEQLEKTKRDLEQTFEELLRGVGKNHQGNAHGKNGQMLAARHAVFYVPDEPGVTGTISGPGAIADYFKKNSGRPFSVEDQVTIFCFDIERPGAVGDDAIDFVAVIRFGHKFDNGSQDQDPPGDVMYFHRKICTWI